MTHRLNMTGPLSTGLPLLIVKGKITSLDLMSVEELETFIPFLVKCSVKRAGAVLKNDVPEWWLPKIPFRFPLNKPKGLSQTGWKNYLSSTVCKCYYYHNAQFLLPFCGEIAKNPSAVRLVANNDKTTTSLFYSKHPLPLLTFKNENKNYDIQMNRNERGNNKRSLLLLSPKRPNVITDIFLCENCDGEFSAHTDMRKHEEECFGSSQNLNAEKEHINIIDNQTVIEKESSESTFLNYFELAHCSVNSTRCKNPKVLSESPTKRWVNIDMCLFKNRGVEFSSLFGQRMLARSARKDFIQRVDKSLSHNEYFCVTSNRGYSKRFDLRPKYTFKKLGPVTRTYSFTKKDRIERCKTICTGLNTRSRKLKAKCKRCSVKLTKLKKDMIQQYIAELEPSIAEPEPILTEQEPVAMEVAIKEEPTSWQNCFSLFPPISLNNNTKELNYDKGVQTSKCVTREVLNKQIVLDVIDLCSSDDDDS